MSNDIKILFEKYLQSYLKEMFTSERNMKFLKKKIIIKAMDGNLSNAEIYFDYISSSKEYVMYICVKSPELEAFYEKIQPPYNSNFVKGVTYLMNTRMEVGFKSFSSNMFGSIPLPRDEAECIETCKWIYEKIKDIYLPRIMNIININTDLVNDIIQFPQYYAYPFLTILYVEVKNKNNIIEKNKELIFNKKIIGNKSFDEKLLIDFTK